MRKFLVTILLLFPLFVWARGLSFKEEMHGYTWYEGEYRSISVYLKITIADIDAWRNNPAYSADISGSMVVGSLTSYPLSGTLQILAPAPGDDGRLLTYRMTSATIQFLGVKHVLDNAGNDLLDDMTTLRAVVLPNSKPLPTIESLLYDAAWTSELHFEWWKPVTVLDFTTSMKTLSTPWYEDLAVRLLFITTVFGNLAKVFIPWAV